MTDNSIRLLGADLQVGAAHAGLLCPRCNGGQSREHSMRLWRVPAGLRWRCYRNKCGAGGLVPDVASSVRSAVQRRQQKQSEPRVYYGEPVSLPAEHEQFYERHFGLTPDMLEFAQVMDDVDRNRHVWPVHDPFMRVRGHMLRAASPTWIEPPIPVAEPKSLLFWNTEQPRCAWYRLPLGGPGGPATLLIVEDQISALKAFEHCNTCALLGTSLNEDVAAEIARQGYSEILLALDQDATAQTYKLVRRYSGVLPIRPLPLRRDIKDMSHDEIQELLR